MRGPKRCSRYASATLKGSWVAHSILVFKADTATVLFDAAKAGKLSRGFQDCEQIGSFEKSGVRAALGCPVATLTASEAPWLLLSACLRGGEARP